MPKALALAAVFLFLVTSSHAAEDGRRARIDELIRLTHLHDMLQDQVDRARSYYLDYAQKTVAPFEAAFSAASNPETKGRLGVIVQRYSEQIDALLSADDLTALWFNNYGEGLSDDDLDQIIAFLKSPVGQRNVAANRAANSAYAAAITGQATSRVQDAARRLMADLQAEAARSSEPPMHDRAK